MNARSYVVDTRAAPDDCGLFRVFVPGGIERMSLGEIKATIETGADVRELDHDTERFTL